MPAGAAAPPARGLARLRPPPLAVPAGHRQHAAGSSTPPALLPRSRRFSAVGTIAIPAILYHAQKIALGALWMEVSAVAVMGSTFAVYSYLSDEGGGGFYY